MIRKTEAFLHVAAVLSFVFLASCHRVSSESGPDLVAPASVAGIERMHSINAQLTTGSSPDSDGYRALQALGVDVVVSVDGPPPPVDLIDSLGMRSIHLPVGYGEIPSHVMRSLVRLSDEAAESHLYVHCHKGRHRGPAVAAILLTVRDGGSIDQAMSVLSACGTSPEYVGLWASVEKPNIPEGACSDAALPALVEPDSLIRQMDLIQEVRDRLDDTASIKDARSNLLLLKEAFIELERLHVPAWSVERPNWNSDIRATIDLVESLRVAPVFDAGALGLIDARCDSCHAASRHR